MSMNGDTKPRRHLLESPQALFLVILGRAGPSPGPVRSGPKPSHWGPPGHGASGKHALRGERGPLSKMFSIFFGSQDPCRGLRNPNGTFHFSGSLVLLAALFGAS